MHLFFFYTLFFFVSSRLDLITNDQKYDAAQRFYAICLKFLLQWPCVMTSAAIIYRFGDLLAPVPDLCYSISDHRFGLRQTNKKCCIYFRSKQMPDVRLLV